MTPSKLTGSMLRTWRERMGWSQPETAEKLGISAGSLRNYEHEKRMDKKDGPVLVPLLLDWALSAVDAGLKPFSETLKKKK